MPFGFEKSMENFKFFELNVAINGEPWSGMQGVGNLSQVYGICRTKDVKDYEGLRF
jgi:hypothetical protein